MKKLLQILSILALTALSASAQTISYNGVKQHAVIDVRTPAEFALGHIEGAVNIPLSQIETGINAVEGLRKDSQILLYCRSGNRSGVALDILKKQGFRNVENGGGFTELKQTIKICATHYC